MAWDSYVLARRINDLEAKVKALETERAKMRGYVIAMEQWCEKIEKALERLES